MKSRNWSHTELLLAFNLYCKIPFGQFVAGNAKIKQLAELIGRTPDAVAMKLSNFASLDPYHQARGVKGLSNTSKADREMWIAFTSDWDKYVEESEAEFERISKESIFGHTVEKAVTPAGPTELDQVVKVRRGQRFFRDAVLASYQNQCCVCGTPIPELLNASHIIPWADEESTRLNPTNGLCLCALHDRGFDRGLMTVSPDYEIIISSNIHRHLPQQALEYGFIIYEHSQINLPTKFLPEKAFLEAHNNRYFHP